MKNKRVDKLMYWGIGLFVVGIIFSGLFSEFMFDEFLEAEHFENSSFVWPITILGILIGVGSLLITISIIRIILKSIREVGGTMLGEDSNKSGSFIDLVKNTIKKQREKKEQEHTCEYCGGHLKEEETRCPNCGARKK